MARGGSKRVPRKNVRLLKGEPLVSWPVRAAVASNLFQPVVISTDDEEIAHAAVAAGAVYPFRRPDSVSDDHSTTADVLRVTLTRWKELTGTLPDFCCCLYGTSAFITEKYLCEAKKRLYDAECVMRSHHMNIQLNAPCQYLYMEKLNIFSQNMSVGAHRTVLSPTMT